jgi:hypothetical protein
MIPPPNPPGVRRRKDQLDAGKFICRRAIWVLLFAVKQAVALISPLPFQTRERRKRRRDGRKFSRDATAGEFGRRHDRDKHFKKNICKPATIARAGTLDHLVKPKPMAPARWP